VTQSVENGATCAWSSWECVNCRQPQLEKHDAAVVCMSCGKSYPFIAGIPAFVQDVEAHRRHVDQAMRERPSWFLSEQTLDGCWAHVRQNVNSHIETLLRKYTKPGDLALDLGCGDGRNLPKLLDAGLRAIGTDYSILRLGRAAEGRVGTTYDFLFMADAKNLPIPAGSFDVVYCDQVLEHIPDPGAVLRSIRRILRPSGTLILGVPNEGSWYFQFKFRLKPGLRANTDHISFFTRDSLQKLLVESGLEARESVGVTWGLPASGDRLLRIPTAVDRWFRRFVWYNRAWDSLGEVLLPHQYFELYVACSKPSA
jgi:SAM-dependent methyltransferase